MTFVRRDNSVYAVNIGCTEVDKVAGLVKHVPREWINERGNDVTEKFIEYASPLIVGEPVIPYKNGIPDYMDISYLYPKQ